MMLGRCAHDAGRAHAVPKKCRADVMMQTRASKMPGLLYKMPGRAHLMAKATSAESPTL